MSYCRAGYFAQCDNGNPHGPQAGTAFFGGPEMTGPFHGLQAENARIPFANIGMVKLPDEVSDDQAILLSDIFPMGYFGADIAEITPGDTVAVFGCGPVGQFAILSAKILDARRILAIDSIPSRHEMARAQGGEVIDFAAEHPIEVVRQLTGGIGVDRAIDAAGVDAERPWSDPAAKEGRQQAEQFDEEVEEIAPEASPEADQWSPGDAPSQALTWAVEALEGGNAFDHWRLSAHDALVSHRQPESIPSTSIIRVRPHNQVPAVDLAHAGPTSISSTTAKI